jgi:hypothetical protein
MKAMPQIQNFLELLTMKHNFAAIILTHGRPEKVITYAALRRLGYTGRIVILIDDTDKTADKYKEIFGNQVHVFDKKYAKSISEVGNNFNDLRSTIYPRNVMFSVAKELGLTHFIQLDDDYSDFSYKFDEKYNYIWRSRIFNLDKVFDHFLDFLDSTPTRSICFFQEGDFVGGPSGTYGQKIKFKQKAMNSFFCRTDRPFKCLGQMNEDVNTYVREGSTGMLFFSSNLISLTQKPTQSNSGGMTEIYKDFGTYVKSFYSVMYMPSSVKVMLFPGYENRLHHNIKFKNTVPKILREEIKNSRCL